jgi:hypothetical protein
LIFGKPSHAKGTGRHEEQHKSGKRETSDQPAFGELQSGLAHRMKTHAQNDA